jgi:hypothetical protein
LESHHAFTRDNHPKGTADPARCLRTRKEAGLWLHAWTAPVAFASALTAWSDADHEQYWPSALGSNTPRPFERDDDTGHSPPFVAA